MPRTATAPSSPPATVDEHLAMARCDLAARYLVASGKVVPVLEQATDGVALARWQPLPGAGDRELIAALLRDDTPGEHARVAALLAARVDALARETLTSAGTKLVERRPGRRTAPQAWLEALCSTNPELLGGLARERVAALAERTATWAASGAVGLGRSRLCLRVHEPGAHPDAGAQAGGEQWWLELLVQDADEPSWLLGFTQLWAGRAELPGGSLEDLLRSLARAVAIAPELDGTLDMAEPVGVPLPTAELASFVENRVEPLTEVGVSVLLPAWWTHRGRLRLRLRVPGKSTGPQGVVSEGGFGLDQLVKFTWEAALGERRLTKADLAKLERAAEAKQTLVYLRGEWMHADPDEVRAMLARAGARGEASASALVRASLGVGSLDGGDGPGEPGRARRGGEPVEVVANGWLGRLVADARAAKVEPLATPPGFEGELRSYQERGAGWLCFLGRLGLGACLADDMGLGKTAQVIAALLAERASGPSLVICPVSVLGNWARELERFAPELRVLVHHGAGRHGDDAPFAERAAGVDVVLSTYSLLARDLEHLAKVPWARIVLDEAQQIKNAATATARAARSLSAGHKLALTGTPVENRLAELWSIMHFLNPGLLGSLKGFVDRFARPIERDDDEAAAERLRQLTGPFLLRRLKTDKNVIDDLPDKVERTEHCPLTREQASLYQAVVDELLAVSQSAEGIGRSGAVLAGIAKLKQVCNHPAHFLGDASPLAGRSGKLTRLEELLDEIIDSGDKVLCFTQFTEWGDLLRAHLANRYGVNPLWLHGGVPRRRREELMARFADPAGEPIFLLSLKAGGTGLNLTAASHVIHLDRWWNPAVEDQATDRAYRIGQRRTVLVHKLVSLGTIEERIDEMITSKRALAQRVVGSGERWITKLDTDELREVVALREEEVA